MKIKCPACKSENEVVIEKITCQSCKREIDVEAELNKKLRGSFHAGRHY